MSEKTARLFEFSDFCVNAREYQLTHGDEVVPLSPKVFETLLILVENSGHIVSKEDLIGAIWPDSFVEDSSLTQNISILRKALGEENGGNQFIETVPKRGYRFIMPVRVLNDAAIGTTSEKLVAWKPSASADDVANPEELKKDEMREDAQSSPVPAASISLTRRSFNRMLVASGLVFLLSLAPLVYFRIKKTSVRAPLNSASAIRSIAILPLKPLGNEEKDEYLGLGMADALIIRFSRFRQLSVLPTSTISKYTERAQDPLTIGRELGVEAVLDGTVQHKGDRFRVTIMLISVNDGRTLWSDKFDERYLNVFSLQDSISEKVAEAMSLQLSGEEKKLLIKHDAPDLEAYQNYLIGLYFWNKRTKDDLIKAVDYFQQAIAQDPDYAPAVAGLADAYTLIAYYRYSTEPRSITYAKARELALKALEIDNTLAEAYTVLGMVSTEDERDYRKAGDLYRKAIELNPNYGAVHVRYGWLSFGQGDLDVALQEMKKGQELDPVSPYTNTALGEFYYYRQNYDEAIKFSRKAVALGPSTLIPQFILSLSYEQKEMYDEALKEINKAKKSAKTKPDVVTSLEILGHLYAQLGRKDEARKILFTLQEMQRKNPGDVEPSVLVILFEALGERDQALAELQKAFENKTSVTFLLKVDPRAELLRADPRYIELQRLRGASPAQ